MRILINRNRNAGRHKETFDIHYLNPGGTNFSLVTPLSIRVAKEPNYEPPEFAFSADGSKFAITNGPRGLSVWDIQSKVPLRTFKGLTTANYSPLQRPQFSSGNLGKEILVFVEVRLMFKF